MQHDRVYFTWPDRRLCYECRGCGACCKGHGIGIDAAAGELVQLVARRPELAAFVRKRGESTIAFNPRDRCWFFEDDGRCRVEVEDGRAAKPAACRLFPFNRVFRAGAYTVVDYNSVICPLAVVADGGVAHDDVLGELATLRDPGLIGSVPADDELLAREHAIASAVFAHAGGSVDAAWLAQAGGERDTAGFETLTGLPWRAPDGATLHAALALTPSLRFNELYGPRQYAPRAKLPLAAMWLAWLGFAALGERLARRALGMQELTTLWSEQAPLMYALARWHDVPSLKPGRIEAPADPLARVLGERCLANRKPARSLGALVADAFGDAVPAARCAALKSAEPVLRTAFG